uniref:Cohesin subunit SA n=1 Tax=Oreochromis niloticus TaxID=8128 RepID=A0A669ERK5_ORENI
MLWRQICVCAFRLIFTLPRLEIVANYFSRLYFLHLSCFQTPQRRRRRTHESSENVKCKSPKASCSGARRAGRGHGKQKHVEAVTLFEVITMGRSAMQAVIDDWIEAYGSDRDSSLLDLISFFIQCSGCKGVVTAEMCQSKEDSEVMSKMVEELDEDSVEYPLVQSGPYGRWFHSEFCDFVSVLVAQCQHSIIFDGYLMNTLISLLTELSNSYVRAFRHTCTLAAVKLLSSLVGVALTLSAGIENSQKLYEVQKTKTMRQKSAQQLEKVQKKIAELQEKRAEIESMMDIIFKGVFLKRYRDVLPEIRCVCMEELGLWMKLYSSVFLSDSYLKYVGWMMHDKVPDVRLKCVLALHGLYGDPLFLPKLDLFTSRFKERIVSMTLDKDSEVSVQTMKLLVLISKTSDDVLTPEDYKHLLQFVYSSQRPLAATAGELLFSRYDGSNEEEACKQQTFARLKALLCFQLHNHVVYLVDSLWDCGGALLKDWPSFTSALLQDSSSCSPGKKMYVLSVPKSLRVFPHQRFFCGLKAFLMSSHFFQFQAFLGVCDVLTAHSYQLHVWDPTSFGPLLYTPSPKLQRALLTFVCVHVFVGSDCDSQSRGETPALEKLEDLHKRRNVLAAYCKLIIHGVLEMSMAAEVFMYYMKYYNDFGDIIKETMYRTRQMDKIESARTLVLCLQQLFVRLKQEQERGGRPHPGVQTFTSIKELARRFALTFGDLVKFRECVVLIHRNGIEFVFQDFTQTPDSSTPLYLSYLTILSEFSSKLLKPDKKAVFSYLQKHTAEHIIDLREECWQPLIYYRASLFALAEGEDAVSYVSSDRKANLPNRSPFSKQKWEGRTAEFSQAQSNFLNITSCFRCVSFFIFRNQQGAQTELQLKVSPSEVFSNQLRSRSHTYHCNLTSLISHQEKAADTDPFSVPLDPPPKRLHAEGSVICVTNEPDDGDGTVEVEL